MFVTHNIRAIGQVYAGAYNSFALSGGAGTPQACTLHPTPQTLHPKPCTLHPAPHTLNPEP